MLLKTSIIALLLLLAGPDPLNWSITHWSWRESRSSLSAFVRPRHGGLVGTHDVERPIWRWLPLIKVGVTIHRQTYQYEHGPGTVYERVVTTETRLVVVGLCSPHRYEELADVPHEDARAKFAKP